MSECLITKLKSAVNDYNLTKIGGFIAEVNSTSSFECGLASFVQGTLMYLTIIEEGYEFTMNGVSSKTISIDYSPTVVTFPAGNYHVNVDSSYLAKVLSFGSKTTIKTSDLKYQSKLEKLNASLQGTLEDISKLNLVDMNISHSELNGSSISFLPLCGFCQINYANISGDISSLSRLYLNNNNVVVNISKNEAVGGKIESLVANLRLAGATEGSFLLNVAKTAVTFGAYSNFADITNVVLKWTADSITYQMGSDDAVASGGVTIYAHGASDSQISEWQSAGNNVVVVTL